MITISPMFGIICLVYKKNLCVLSVFAVNNFNR